MSWIMFVIMFVYKKSLKLLSCVIVFNIIVIKFVVGFVILICEVFN